IHQTDGAPIPIRLTLWTQDSWYARDLEPRARQIAFFEGVFLIMAVYNLVLFFILGFRAYIYYALYLLSVAVFVAFAAGPLAEPPFGEPTRLIPFGYLAFGLINIFYFLFGRSFLNTRNLLPRFHRFLHYYLVFRGLSVLITQGLIWITFNLYLALQIEAALMLPDILISLVFFGLLIRKNVPLSTFFITGSLVVMGVGLSLAVLGHFFQIAHSFSFFLGTIVFEIICFSLGLGYRIRRSEREKYTFEREQRKAQEALNQELSKINTAFGRFVPQEFLRSLGHDSILDVQLGDGVEKEVTVLFTDIRDYSGLSESMSPQENFRFLNAYLGRVGPVIQSHRGFVNQYYGDGIMALFLRSPEDAVLAAIEIHRVLRYYNVHRVNKGRQPIRLGIGIHSGSLMMGVIGDTLRLEAGVVSDTVNTASRMEGLTKHFHASILISEHTYGRIVKPQRFRHRFLGKVQVKGRQSATGVYDFFEGESDETAAPKLATLAPFEAGLKAYFAQDFVAAARHFDEVLAIFPEDKVTQHYQAYTIRYLTEGVPPGWTGVETMEKK
ncbi:MAG: adenylate/guanylate cyclase domain-containing protein, partial [Bacteroidetes bacterium]